METLWSVADRLSAAQADITCRLQWCRHVSTSIMNVNQYIMMVQPTQLVRTSAVQTVPGALVGTATATAIPYQVRLCLLGGHDTNLPAATSTAWARGRSCRSSLAVSI